MKIIACKFTEYLRAWAQLKRKKYIIRLILKYFVE
jgi:hypothetical protein